MTLSRVSSKSKSILLASGLLVLSLVLATLAVRVLPVSAASINGTLGGDLCTGNGGIWVAGVGGPVCRIPNGVTWSVDALKVPCGGSLVVTSGAVVTVNANGNLTICFQASMIVNTGGSVALDSGAKLVNNGTFTNSGILTIDGGRFLNVKNPSRTALFNNQPTGIIVVGNAASSEFDNWASMYNRGALVLNGGDLVNKAGANLRNQGYHPVLLVNNSGSAFSNEGYFYSLSIIEVKAGSISNSGTGFYNGGLLNLESGTMTNSGPGFSNVAFVIIGSAATFTNNAGGILRNTGRIVNSGTMNSNSGSALYNNAKLMNLGTINYNAGGFIKNTPLSVSRVIDNFGSIVNNQACIGGYIVPAPPSGFAGSFTC